VPGDVEELVADYLKDERAASALPVASGLLFTYPVHQAADILFCHGDVVPVGKDHSRTSR
jgi:tryptophanyl-tRNA synthetase